VNNGTTKDFQITDHLGNVRTIISKKVVGGEVSVSSYDYKPFGDTLWTRSGSENRLGFIGRERDYENNYFAFGARNYDSETGRFLSVDPLFEAFPNQTPYHYAYNSPIQFKDPSGLAPEEEKKERVMHNLTMEDVWQYMCINISSSEVTDEANEWNSFYSYQSALGMYGKFSWRSHTPASPWAYQKWLNWSCWGRFDYSFGNGAWRPNLSELMRDKQGLFDGHPPLQHNNETTKPRLGTIGGGGLFENNKRYNTESPLSNIFGYPFSFGAQVSGKISNIGFSLNIVSYKSDGTPYQDVSFSAYFVGLQYEVDYPGIYSNNLSEPFKYSNLTLTLFGFNFTWTRTWSFENGWSNFSYSAESFSYQLIDFGLIGRTTISINISQYYKWAQKNNANFLGPKEWFINKW